MSVSCGDGTRVTDAERPKVPGGLLARWVVELVRTEKDSIAVGEKTYDKLIYEYRAKR